MLTFDRIEVTSLRTDLPFLLYLPLAFLLSCAYMEEEQEKRLKIGMENEPSLLSTEMASKVKERWQNFIFKAFESSRLSSRGKPLKVRHQFYFSSLALNFRQLTSIAFFPHLVYVYQGREMCVRVCASLTFYQHNPRFLYFLLLLDAHFVCFILILS